MVWLRLRLGGFERNLARRFPPQQQKAVLELCMDQKRLEQTPVNEFVDLMAVRALISNEDWPS